jgi:hypothetical protein
VSEPSVIRHPVVRIEVRVQVGATLMAATDDPVYLGLRGDAGREFRLKQGRGHSLRRGREEHFVLGAPDDPATNVAQPEFNDPTRPVLDAEQITGVYVRKGLEPIPNVRGLGEMDDRLEIESIQVEITVEGWPKARRYTRGGPVWLGLICGTFLEIPRADDGA